MSLANANAPPAVEEEYEKEIPLLQLLLDKKTFVEEIERLTALPQENLNVGDKKNCEEMVEELTEAVAQIDELIDEKPLDQLLAVKETSVEEIERLTALLQENPDVENKQHCQEMLEKLTEAMAIIDELIRPAIFDGWKDMDRQEAAELAKEMCDMMKRMREERLKQMFIVFMRIANKKNYNICNLGRLNSDCLGMILQKW
tara:strand:+ start:147 stop:749 length:603 start_codon:yes stop_codon:yes gene_type:complete